MTHHEPRDAALFATLASSFDLVHDVMDQWGQHSWAAANKGKHGPDPHYLDGQPENDGQTTRVCVTWLDKQRVTATTLGRLACTHHVAMYTLGQLAAAIVTTRTLGYRVPLRHLVVGHVAINGVTHWIIDRRTPLHTLAKLAGKEGYARFHGKTLPNRQSTVYGPGTATFELDKSLHRFIGWSAALVTTWLAVRHG